jgi:hypothetical protein
MDFEIDSVGPSFRLPLEFPLVGTGYGERASAIRRYAKRGSKVRLEREPDNSHDPNAIAVILTRRTQGGRPIEDHIGYVPAGLAEEITDLLHARRLAIAKAEVCRVRALDGDDWPRVTIRVEGSLGEGITQGELPT